MTETILQKNIFLKATPAQAWDYLTEPDKLGIWFHKPKAPLIEGKPYEMFGTESGDLLMWGNVVKATPYDYLEYTFTIKPMGDTTSTVKWRITEVPGGVRLSLEHSGLPQGAEAYGLALALDKGWEDHMARMRADLHEPTA
ncbi:MAG: SRPBCC domain-containing protein [Pseudoruegeria sp.]